MAFINVPQPTGTGFFVFPLDAENLQAKVPHDWTRTYPLAPFERGVDPKTWAQLKQRVGGGRLSVVGLWPDDAVTKKWDLIVGGETCFFCDRGGLVAAGTIVHNDRNRTLAEAVFGKGSPGTHELLVLLVDVEPLAMSLERFFDAIGRKSRAPFRTFTNLTKEHLVRIEERFGSVFGFLEAAKPRAAETD